MSLGLQALPHAAHAPALIGRSPRFESLKRRLHSVARAQRCTLITGPTGCGKDLIARALHAESVRHQHPFVAVHCAALPDTLVEAELFGHSRGAFTGASRSRSGLIRTAAEGTLFLDEVDSLSPPAQAKLLRFLETGEYRAVGSDHVDFSNAWVIAATNQDLADRVRQGSFRSDLLFRLEVVKLDVPPLAERAEDIVTLAEHFLASVSAGAMRFADEARTAMLSYDWPGNVRELKHRVESAALLSESATIDAAALRLAAPEAGATACEASTPAWPRGAGSPLEQQLWTLLSENGLTLAQAMRRCERLLIGAALRAEGNNRTRAAGRLGIHVRTIFKKLPT
jgi:DNA-binding NtrC family response regulator